MLTVDITKQLPDFTLDIAFTLTNHSLVLFGPSGCGKTTSLRCIAGLTTPDSGTIAYGDTLLFSHAKKSFLPPCKRRVGFMFQDYALFPHLNVKQNILYGAKKKETGDALSELLTTLKIPHLLHRSIPQLSGGEKQRVALARALMAEPNILLLDEPLSALDHETRLEVQTELKRLQKTWSIPFILVTHDRKEAEAMGDEILFLDKGHIVEHKKLNSAN